MFVVDGLTDIGGSSGGEEVAEFVRSGGVVDAAGSRIVDGGELTDFGVAAAAD